MTQEHNTEAVPFPPRSDGWDTMRVNYAQIEDSDLLSSHFYMEDASALSNSVHRIIDEYSAKRPYFRETSGCVLKKLLIALHRFSPTEIPPKIRKIKAYIDENYASDLTNEQLASMAGYHEFYLNRLFLSCLGVNLHRYLLNARLNRASYLILNTNLPLKSIPGQIGFRSYPHFSSYFKQQYGFSPAEYRKKPRGSILTEKVLNSKEFRTFLLKIGINSGGSSDHPWLSHTER